MLLCQCVGGAASSGGPGVARLFFCLRGPAAEGKEKRGWFGRGQPPLQQNPQRRYGARPLVAGKRDGLWKGAATQPVFVG